MRGKLRDKRATKKEVYSREGSERRRPYKRDARVLHIGAQDEAEFDLALELDEYEDEFADEGEEMNEIPIPQKQKK